MRVKRFVGDSVAEIMKRIKQELGSEAVILQTRHFKEGGFIGLFGQSRVEVMAALEDSPGSNYPRELLGTQEKRSAQDKRATPESRAASAKKTATQNRTAVENWIAEEKRNATTSRDTGESRVDKVYASHVAAGMSSMPINPGKPIPHSLGSPKTGSTGVGSTGVGSTGVGSRGTGSPESGLSATGLSRGIQTGDGLSESDAATEKLLKTIAQARAQYALEEASTRLQQNQDPANNTSPSAGLTVPAGSTAMAGSVAQSGSIAQSGSTQVLTPVSAQTGTALNPSSLSYTPFSLSSLVQADPDAIEQILPLITVTQGDMKELKSMMREIHYYLNAESGGAGFVPEPLEKWRDYLCSRGVSETMCRELLFQVQINLKRELWQNDRYVLDLLQKNILDKCSRTQIIDIKALKKKDKPLVMALVGPTGVGKTTTIGKLSAGFSIVESRKVSLVAADTYRVAAVEQLRTFGEILGIPVDVVMNATGLKESIAKHADKDVIIIDTAGRSPNHVMHMGELEEFMQVAQPDLTLLVISATTSPAEQALVLERFRPLSTHLILTKLDESRCEGVLLDLVTRTDLPLTYLTHGQNVPDDIDVATPEKLMGWILGEGVIKDVS